MAAHGIRNIPHAKLCELAFTAYQDGNMATHDALIRESLRRQFVRDPEITKPAPITRALTLPPLNSASEALQRYAATPHQIARNRIIASLGLEA